MCIESDPRPERPRRSTNERSVKLVADALEEDRRATCEEFSIATGTKTSQENAQDRTSVSRGRATHSPLQSSTAVEQAVACAPVTQRARVRSPVGTSFLGEVFQGFSSPVRQMSGSYL